MITNYRGIWVAAAGILMAASLGGGVSAKADTAILNQISGGISGNVSASQMFEDDFSEYDVAAGDDFLVSTVPRITNVQAVIGGYNGYVGSTGITGYEVEIYSSQAAAGNSLTGDVFSESLSPAQVTVDDTTFTAEGGSLVTLPVDITLAPGTYYLAVLPDNSFEDDGQTGIFNSLSTSGGTNAFQANPGGGFGFGATQTISPATDLAYAVYAVPEPATCSLLGLAFAGVVFLRRRAAVK